MTPLQAAHTLGGRDGACALVQQSALLRGATGAAVRPGSVPGIRRNVESMPVPRRMCPLLESLAIWGRLGLFTENLDDRLEQHMSFLNI